MAAFTKTWWGRIFLEALEKSMDPARLRRGATYARTGRVLDFQLLNGKIKATVMGRRNPYFGVYHIPEYKVVIQVTPISNTNWKRLIKSISSDAGYITKLMMNDMPDDIEEAFAKLGLCLLPRRSGDLKTTCSCPDWANPCKHVAGVYYLLASELDNDPFLMFRLRGLEPEQLRRELAKTPLGKILLSEVEDKEVQIEKSETYFTRPKVQKKRGNPDPASFWQGQRKKQEEDFSEIETVVAAALIKKQGDYPPFWEKSDSFIETMEEFYQRVRMKNK